MFDQGAVTLFRVRGIPIRAHWTLLLIVPYLAIALSQEFRAVPDLAGVDATQLVLPPLVWGVLLALGLFASITLHELAHGLAAMRFGGRVRSITLMLVGGVSQIGRMSREPRHEAIVAAVGPLVSIVLGAVLSASHGFSAAWPADVQMALFYLGGMNVVLGLFNLLPAFPMDGGRLVRALLASSLGTTRATEIAARLGMVCAVVFFVLGLWSSSWMLLLVAVFVYSGAKGEIGAQTVRDALDGLRIVDLLPLLRRPPPVIEAERPLAGILGRMRELDRLELVVVDADSVPRAIVQAGDLAAIPSSDRWTTTAGELAQRLPRRHVVIPWDVSANDALERAGEADAGYVVVIDPRAEPRDAIVGLVATDDISRMVTFQLVAGVKRAA